MLGDKAFAEINPSKSGEGHSGRYEVS